MCLFYERLDKGTFRLPDMEDDATSVALEERACTNRVELLVGGIDNTIAHGSAFGSWAGASVF